MTLQQLYEEAKKQLKSAGIEEAELDARYLLLDVFQLTYASYLLNRNKQLTEAQNLIKHKYYENIEKRKQHIPLQHIIGTQEFMGLEFTVTPDVLIPRQDTETLVEAVLTDHPSKEKHILDLCTGSGCIAVSLAVLGGYHHITAIDISEKALAIAKKNAQHLCSNYLSQFTFIQSDLFEGLKAGTRFDMIVSNPPYIPTDVIDELQSEVRMHEPVLALDGKKDGLFFYRKIISQIKRHLKADGYIYLEVGHDQSKAVSHLLNAAGFTKIEAIKDIPGVERVIKARNY